MRLRTVRLALEIHVQERSVKPEEVVCRLLEFDEVADSSFGAFTQDTVDGSPKVSGNQGSNRVVVRYLAVGEENFHRIGVDPVNVEGGFLATQLEEES